MEKRLSSVRNLGASSNTSLAAPTSRYNLRNRGPAPFAKMAEQECPICFSSVYEAPVVLNCEHTICGPCTKKVLAKYKNCPICNTVLIRALFLNDTSYTRKLTKRNRSPVKPTTRSAGRAAKSEPSSEFVRDGASGSGVERLSRKRRLQNRERTPERSEQQQLLAGSSQSVALCVTPLARPSDNKVMMRVVF
uniref:(northern house mosquito) hypothetical protein n=1 Tax=Culex pipiens TaxID=7175 RepID=A0A8D8C2T3_CULPI